MKLIKFKKLKEPSYKLVDLFKKSSFKYYLTRPKKINIKSYVIFFKY